MSKISKSKFKTKYNIFNIIISGIIDVSITQPLVYWKLASKWITKIF